MQTIKAAIGVLRNKNQEILIAKRRKSQFMGGFWELPGGKQELLESSEQALIRELNEELGIKAKHLTLHQMMTHYYQDRIVNLSIYNVNQYQEIPKGAEGQTIAWVKPKDLENYRLLPSMKGFLDSITLPDKYWITPSCHCNQTWIDTIEQKLTQDVALIQLRSKKTLNDQFIAEVSNKCKQNKAKLLLNVPNKTFNETHCDGWHLTANELLALKKRPCSDNKLLGASTHNLDEALKAQEIGVNFIVLSPVKTTQTHPDAKPLGWDKAVEITRKVNIPVYFLGGMKLKDLEQTCQLGIQGIAGISAFD